MATSHRLSRGFHRLALFLAAIPLIVGGVNEQIVTKLRQIEVLQGHGKSLAVACKEVGTTEQSYYRYRMEYGGLGVDQAKRLKRGLWPDRYFVPGEVRGYCTIGAPHVQMFR